MVRAQGVIARAVAALFFAGLLVVAGCSRGECGTGAESASQAVRGVLTGLAKDSDREICRYVPEGKVDSARAALSVLQGAVSEHGGLGSVTVVESTQRRMGNVHVVDVGAGGATLASVVVVEEDGVFLVFPGAEPPVK